MRGKYIVFLDPCQSWPYVCKHVPSRRLNVNSWVLISPEIISSVVQSIQWGDWWQFYCRVVTRDLVSMIRFQPSPLASYQIYGYTQQPELFHRYIYTLLYRSFICCPPTHLIWSTVSIILWGWPFVLTFEYILSPREAGLAQIKQIAGDHRKPIMTRRAW